MALPETRQFGTGTGTASAKHDACTGHPQLNLLADLSRGKLVPRWSVPRGRPGALARALHLAGSLCGFAVSFVRPTMAVRGNSLAWARGEIALGPGMGMPGFARELWHRRLVLFVTGDDGSPFDTLSDSLGLDRAVPVASFLNGNDTLVISGTRSGCKILIHLGNREAGRSAIERHKSGLSRAREALSGSPLLGLIAEALPAPVHDSYSAFAQTFLEGRQLNVRAIALDGFANTLMRAASPLFEIRRATLRDDGAPELAFLRRIKADLPGMNANVSVRSGIEEVIGKVEAWLQVRQPGAVFVHGDYLLTNLLFDARNEVAAITDWEWSRPEGANGYDAVYLGIRAGAERFGVHFAMLAAELVRNGKVPAPLWDYLETCLPKIGLNHGDAVPLAMLAWLATVFRTGVWTQPPHGGWMEETTAPMFDAVREMQ